MAVDEALTRRQDQSGSYARYPPINPPREDCRPCKAKPPVLFQIERNLGREFRVRSRKYGDFTMASPARIFFAGVGTTFAILAVGFGGGVLMANSTLSGTSPQKQASSEPLAAARIVYPNSAEPTSQVAASVPTKPTSAPQVATQAAADPGIPVPAPSLKPVTPAASASQTQSQIEERSKTRRELRAERRQRYAERRALRRQRQLVSPDQREPGIMAFDGDASRPSTGFFGN